MITKFIGRAHFFAPIGNARYVLLILRIVAGKISQLISGAATGGHVVLFAVTPRRVYLQQTHTPDSRVVPLPRRREAMISAPQWWETELQVTEVPC
jgi:hypothetical protein